MLPYFLKNTFHFPCKNETNNIQTEHNYKKIKRQKDTENDPQQDQLFTRQPFQLFNKAYWFQNESFLSKSLDSDK